MKAILCLLIGHAWKRTGIGQWSEDHGWRHEHQCTRCQKRMWE